MAGCGYVCPVCEGRNFLEDGSSCDYCLSNRNKSEIKKTEMNHPDSELNDWIETVHEGPCCWHEPSE